MEAIFRRVAIRRHIGLPPLDTKRAYAHGLNKLEMINVQAKKLHHQVKEREEPMLFRDEGPGSQGNIVQFDAFNGEAQA